MSVIEEEVITDHNSVVTRLHNEATHVGEFLGIQSTGRKIAWNAINIVYVKDGRVIGQWAQPDLWGIYQQLTVP